MQNYSDQQLIDAYLEGDQKSLEFLIKRYLKPIYSFIYRYTGNAQEVEDITQEVFLKVWRNLKKFDPKRSHFLISEDRQQKSFKTWIFSIAKNAAIDWLRKKKSIPFSDFETEEGKNKLIETLVDPAPLPSEILEKANIGETLTLAIDKLSPRLRAVLFLRYNDHFKFREIAEILGESSNTVRSWHRRALFRLKKSLLNY